MYYLFCLGVVVLLAPVLPVGDQKISMGGAAATYLVGHRDACPARFDRSPLSGTDIIPIRPSQP